MRSERPRPAPMYLIARGPKPYPIASAHEDESLCWELTIAPLGSPPTKVPARPAHILREVREWLAADSRSFREANARGEPLTPFPAPPAPDLALLERHRKARLKDEALIAALDEGGDDSEAVGVLVAAMREKWGDRWIAKALRLLWMAEHDYEGYWSQLDPVVVPGYTDPEGKRSVRPTSHLPRGINRAAQTAKKMGWPILASPSFQRDVAGGMREKTLLLDYLSRQPFGEKKEGTRSVDRRAAELGVALLSNVRGRRKRSKTRS